MYIYHLRRTDKERRLGAKDIFVLSGTELGEEEIRRRAKAADRRSSSRKDWETKFKASCDLLAEIQEPLTIVACNLSES